MPTNKAKAAQARRIQLPPGRQVQVLPVDVTPDLRAPRAVASSGPFKAAQNILYRKKSDTYKLDPCREPLRAKVKKLRHGQTELLLINGDVGRTLGVPAGAYVRLCFAMNKPGFLVRVKDAQEARDINLAFKAAIEAGMDLYAAAESVAQAHGGGGALGGAWSTYDGSRKQLQDMDAVVAHLLRTFPGVPAPKMSLTPDDANAARFDVRGLSKEGRSAFISEVMARGLEYFISPQYPRMPERVTIQFPSQFSKRTRAWAQRQRDRGLGHPDGQHCTLDDRRR
jgi:hypothetical protein